MSSLSLLFGMVFKGYRIFPTLLVVWPSGIRPGLSPKDEEVKRKLVKCAPRSYSELIRSDILGSSGSKSSRPLALRPSPPSIMKFRHEGPPIIKPTWEELQDRVEALSRRSRSIKRKPEASPERSRPDRGKTPRLGPSSPSSSAKIRVKGQALPPLTEVPRVIGPRRRSSPTAVTKGPSGRAA